MFPKLYFDIRKEFPHIDQILDSLEYADYILIGAHSVDEALPLPVDLISSVKYN